MKITKSYLKQIIKEELEKIDEIDIESVKQTTSQTNAIQSTESPEQIKDNLRNQIKSLDAQVKAAEAAAANLPNLKKQLQDARTQLGKS